MVLGARRFAALVGLQFSRLASQARRPREPCPSSIAKLGTSRWAGAEAPYSRSSSLRCPVSPLQGGPDSLLLLSLTGEERCSSPDPSSNRSGSKAAFSPLVVGGARRFAALVELRFQDARLQQAGGGTWSLALPRLQSWAPFVGFLWFSWFHGDASCLASRHVSVSVPASWDRPSTFLLGQLRG